jgi:adenosylcobyric acid synthase
VVGLPYLSNFTDFTALENVPDVIVYYTRKPEEARAADVLVLPGSKNTIPDLLWLRSNGWEDLIRAHVAAHRPLVGICGGFQMMGREIRDPFQTESDIEAIPGLGLLDAITVLAREKITRQAKARLLAPARFAQNGSDPLFIGYEIHLGETRLGDRARPLFQLTRLGDSESSNDGAVSDDGSIFGTYLHGLFDSADGLALLLAHWRKLRGKKVSTAMVVDPFAERERRYDALAEHYRRNLRMEIIQQMINGKR